MESETESQRKDRVANAVERLTRIYGSILELNREANQIRTSIRDFDVNVEALNLLASARSRDQKGGGEQVLHDLISYARQTGLQIETHDRSPPLVSDDAPAPVPTIENRDSEAEWPASKELLKLVAQVGVAIAVTSGLFVLIH